MKETAHEPLVFRGCTVLLEMTGDSARDVAELLDGIADAPRASIFHHTHGFILGHRFTAPSFINEFAKWADRDLQEPALAERLSGVDPVDFPDLEDLRWELVRVLDEYVGESHRVPRIVFGQPFYFLRAWLQSVPTGKTARTLLDLRQGIATCDLGTIYYHMIETGGEVAAWIRDALERPDLAERVRSIDTFMYSLEGLRRRLLEVIDDGTGGA